MLAKIRSLLIFVALVIALVIVAVFFIPALMLFGPKKTVWLRRLGGYFMITVACCRLKVINPLMSWGVPVVYAFSHESAFDILMIAAAIPEYFSVIAKKELLKVPVFGSIVKRMGFIFIDRRNRKESSGSINLALDKLLAGISVVVFAEGTRTDDGNVGPFKRGAFQLAKTAMVPIVPARIKGGYYCNPRGLNFRPGQLSITFGEPITLQEYCSLSVDDLTKLCRDRIMAM